MGWTRREYPQNLDDWEAGDWEAFFSESEPELPGDAVADDGYEDAPPDLVGVAEAGTSSGGTGEHGSDSSPALTPDEWVDWHFDDSGYYAYITLNGTRELVQRWVAALHDAGYKGSFFGRSVRPADNGRRYDWYVRVMTTDGKKPDRGSVIALFGEPPRHGPAEVYVANRRLRQQLAELERRYQVVREADAINRQRVARLLARLKQVIAEWQFAQSANEAHTREIQRLKAEVQRLTEAQREVYEQLQLQAERAREAELSRAELERTTVPLVQFETERRAWLEKNALLETELQELREKYARMAADLKDFEVLYQEKEEETHSLRERVQALENELAILQAQFDMEEADRVLPAEGAHGDDRAGTGWSARIDRHVLRQFIEIFAPNVELVGGSVDFIAMELKDPTDCLRKIAALSRGERMLGERFESASDFLKLRFKTGRDHGGRLYYRRLGNGKCRILVSHKSQQARDEVRLKNLTGL